MQIKTLFYFSVITIALYSCSNNTSGEKTGGTVADTLNAPVEKNKPNTSYKPAFEGQTRVKGITTTTPYKVDSIAGALLGVTKYAFCLSVIFWLANSVKISLPHTWTSGSYLYPLTAKFAERTSGYLGNFIPFFKEIFRQF